MLPISRLCDTAQLQKALSVATNNFVSKQSTVQQAAAALSGFESFQQALALTDRSEMIINSLWAEQYNWTHHKLWHIHAGHYTLCINTADSSIEVSHLDGEMVDEIPLPNALTDYVIAENEIEYDHCLKKLVIRTLVGIDIVFHRYGDNNLGVLINHRDTSQACTSKCYDIHVQAIRESMVLLDTATQLPRLLDEISAACEHNMSQIAAENEITEQYITDTINTASWLFELDKGNDDYASELKPKHTLAAPIGYIADLYLSKSPNQDFWVTQMCDSMSIDTALLNFFRGMAKADSKVYLFKHYLKHQ